MPEEVDERVEELQKETGFPEEVVGCYLSNYKVRHVCPIALGGWCKEFVRCRLLDEIERGV